MEIDISGESNGSTAGVKENGLHLFPVSLNDSGEGLPYAPVDWPNHGDTWSWKVGRRIAQSGYFVDRYLYLPMRLRQQSASRRITFASRLSVEQYIKTAFPDADVDAFFASFSWKIPAKNKCLANGNEEENAAITFPSEEVVEHSGSDSQFAAVGCKAGNKMCSSLEEATDSPFEAMYCNLCCNEPGFCRDCSCILCHESINAAYGEYGVIKCEAIVGGNLICGHIAHIVCALRSYMAGTVGGRISLDAEYHCRRCDMRTDLVSCVSKVLKTCESMQSRDDISRMLNVWSCALRGSQRTTAKSLLHRIELVMTKLKSGTFLEDIWKTEDTSAVIAGELPNDGNDGPVTTVCQESLDFEAYISQVQSGNFNIQIESPKLEDEIDRILQALKKAQESEYQIAEERLYAQKNYFLSLYRQLSKERSELATCKNSDEPGALIDSILRKSYQVRREIKKLKDMAEVAKGFGKTPKDILKEHFGLEMK